MPEQLSFTNPIKYPTDVEQFTWNITYKYAQAGKFQRKEYEFTNDEIAKFKEFGL